MLDIGVAMLAAMVTIYFPILTRQLMGGIKGGDLSKTNYIVGGLFLLVLLRTLFTYIRVKWGHILGVRMEYDMRAELFRHLQKLSFNYYDSVKTGHIMSRISNDLNLIAEIAHHCPEDIIISLFLMVGGFIAMFSFNVKLATIALIPILPMFAWGILYGGKMRKGFRKVRRRIADINSSVENSVQGIREVKSYANEDQEIDKFRGVNIDFRLAKEKIYGVMSTFFSGMEFLTESYFLIVISGGVWLIKKGEMDQGTLLAFVLYVYFMIDPIRRLVQFTEQFQQGGAAFERFIEIMDIEPDIVDRADANTLGHVKGEICISNLFFKYKASPDWVLRGIDMEIPAHKTVAIVGESGAGKSTIASLIPRFYEPQEGSITIDDHDIMGLKQKFLRENIGIVQQNVFLFDSTIRENIMYGRLDATEEDMIQAAKNANIYDFIMSLPDGFNTSVGERGVKLSGGQKQRISIARVFLKNPPIFVFDEATSSLDTESESLIQKSLELLSHDRTTIVIAHRLSTVKNADLLYVLRDGQVVEKGTHEELLAQQKYYHSLYSMNLF